MTTAKQRQTFRLPDRPEREPDDMTSFKQLANTSIIEPLRHHLGRRETTLITGEQYLCDIVRPKLAGARYPDLLIAFNADLEAHRSSNGYIISEQGKPPDFVLEIASQSTANEDTGRKRRDYANMGIPEYWRFDETGDHHGTRLAGDRLVGSQYHPLTIEETEDGALQGYSPVLNLLLRWEMGLLKWHDPETGQHIATYVEEREARIREREALIQERDARLQAQEAARQEREARIQEREARIQEREARIQAEARARELEALLENLGNQ